MELLTGDPRKPDTDDDFVNHVHPFDSTDGGCDWVYSDRHSVSVIRAQSEGNDGGLVTPNNLLPPQKLRPIRYGDRHPSDDQHPLDILAGTLEKLPEVGFLGDGCFETPLGSKIMDVEEGDGLARGFATEDPGQVGSGSGVELQGPSSGTGTVRDGMSLSSSLDSDDDSSAGVREPATGKRKRKSREKLERFLEKLVGDMMKRQEKMHMQLIEVIERMERERIQREEAWKQQEMERMKREEEARRQEMTRSSALISFIQTMTGHEIEIPQPLKFPSAEQSDEAQTQKDVRLGVSNNRRWPEEEMQALITIRSEIEEKYSVTGGKGSIWDEVSAQMRGMGFERSAKKCKEKWENMNKYYKKVMEGGKKQPEHSKTRSYFQELESFHKNGSGNGVVVSSNKKGEKSEEG